MAIRVYADSYIDSDFTGTPRLSQPFTLARNTKVKTISTKFLVYNSPTFADLRMRIYADQQGRPSQLLHTCDKIFTLADLLTTHAYGLKECRFDFTTPVWLRKDIRYHLVPFVTTPAFDSTHYLAWVKAYPDPNTDHELPVTQFNIPAAPFYLAMIGADL